MQTTTPTLAEPTGIHLEADGTVTYEKCSACHLFVDRNDSFDDDDTLAPYVHLYGECDLCVETDESHEARPGGGRGTLDYWKANGPDLMKARFDEE
ncbi:hypothetical protein GCM10025867_48940 (plasmid) [Frondihabitans sucicola]|uniref:Small CPxCG-related zinc finger protein n=1 Tax=Frondihabitans sucicola TaxID=1268041 RepID=A0ABM8GW01_9MICO|nr:hypothetical protein [Frondihabitans sucicola]BDZ52653.1 hypothetical protein GCM10025867_48940 [Frondihabitans sucicola]